MFMALARLDFHAAMHYNAAVLFALPFFAAYFIFHSVRYIRCGTSFLPIFAERVIACVMIAAFVVFGIMRNFPMFNF